MTASDQIGAFAGQTEPSSHDHWQELQTVAGERRGHRCYILCMRVVCLWHRIIWAKDRTRAEARRVRRISFNDTQYTCSFKLPMLVNWWSISLKQRKSLWLMPGIAWRFRSDIELILFQKKLMPFCGLLHYLATTQGLGEVGIFDHTITPKMHAAEPWFGFYGWFLQIMFSPFNQSEFNNFSHVAQYLRYAFNMDPGKETWLFI